MLKYFFKSAWRKLSSNRVSSLINILGFSLGIFSSIIIFQFVKYHLSTDRYHKKFKSIYRVVMDLHLDDGSIEPGKGSPFILHKTLKNDFSNIENTAYISQEEMTIGVFNKTKIPNRYKEKESAAFINEDYFKIFDYHWIAGDASSLETPNTAVITKRYAKKYFGNADPLGQVINLNNLQDVKIVGLLDNLPPNTDLKTEVFISLPTMRTIRPDFGYDDWQWFSNSRETYISINNFISKKSIESSFTAFSRKYYGEKAKYYQFHLQELADVHFNSDYNGKIRRSSILLFSIVGIILILIACFNFINLSIAQAFKKFREVGIRKTVGGTQFQLFGQFITEIFLVAVISVLLAVFFAYLTTPVVNNLLDVKIVFEQYFDPGTIIFGFGLIAIITLVAGIYPSLLLTRLNPLKALKGVINKAEKGITLKRGLITTQFAISFMLITISILIVRQINFINNRDIGTAKKLILHINIPDSEKEKLAILKNQLLLNPSIKNITYESDPPSAKLSWGGSIKFDNRDWEKFIARSRSADQEYLNTYKIKLISGRVPNPSDTIREILVNEKLVKNLGLKGPEEVLNKQLIIGDADNRPGIITGVVSDFNNRDLYSAIEPTVIFSLSSRYKEAAISLNNFDPQKTITQIHKTWNSVFDTDVFEYSFYDKELAQFYKKENLTRDLVIFFTFVSIFISCLGLLGLVGIAISQRIKEIGIRKVLGASVHNIISLLSGEILKLISIASLIGLPISLIFMNNWLSDFAFRISISWWIFVLAGLFIFFFAMAIISIRIFIAGLANPVKSLRTE